MIDWTPGMALTVGAVVESRSEGRQRVAAAYPRPLTPHDGKPHIRRGGYGVWEVMLTRTDRWPEVDKIVTAGWGDMFPQFNLMYCCEQLTSRAATWR